MTASIFDNEEASHGFKIVMWVWDDLSWDEEGLVVLLHILPLSQKHIETSWSPVRGNEEDEYCSAIREKYKGEKEKRTYSFQCFFILLSLNLKLLLIRKPFSALWLNGKFKPVAPR